MSFDTIHVVNYNCFYTGTRLHQLKLFMMHFETKSVHTGVHKDSQFNSVITPIYASSTFYWNNIEQSSGYDYTRSGNPTRDALQENLAALEGGISCAATCSGMAAVHCAMSLFGPGDHVVVPADVYGGTFRFISQYLIEKGMLFTFVDMTDLNAVRNAITSVTRGIWIETPSNPMMKVIDLAAVVKVAKKNRRHDDVRQYISFTVPAASTRVWS